MFHDCVFCFNHKDFISWTLSHIAIVKDLVELQHQQYLKVHVNYLFLWIRGMKLKIKCTCMLASTVQQRLSSVHLLSCLSICLVFPSVIFVHLSVFQAQEHMERYLLEEWTLRETDLLRERGLWGPPVGSRLRKWMLDMTEGTDKKIKLT